MIVATFGIMVNVFNLQKKKNKNKKKKQNSLKNFSVILVNNTNISAAGIGTLGLLMSINDIILLLSKAPFIWRKVAPGRRVTRLPELLWGSQLSIHFLAKLVEPFT